MKLDPMKDKQQEQKCISDSSIQKGYDIRYPMDICRFDDDFSHEGLASVRDTKILRKLKQKCEGAKILWEATDQTSVNNLDSVLDQGGMPQYRNQIIHVKQFLVYLRLAVCYAKLLASNGRLNRHRSLLLDKNTINSFYIDSFNKVKYCLGPTYDIDFCHPFAKLIFSCSPDVALEEIQSTKYIGDEGIFIRTNNADRKIILDAIAENLARNKNIVVHRLQISIETIFAPHGYIGSDHFKNELSVVLDRISSLSKNNLLCAMHSIFPSALSQAGLQGFEGTIGHLVLLFSKNALKQNKNLFSFLQNPYSSLTEGTALGMVVMDPTKNGYRSKAVGSMSASSPRQTLEQMADYMTLERRYIKPGCRISSVASFAPCLEKQHTIFVKQFQ